MTVSVFAPIHIGFTLVGLCLWWFGVILGMLEWRDRHADRARARQVKMGRTQYLRTNWIAKYGKPPILALGVAGTLAAVVAVAAAPWASYAVPVWLCGYGAHGFLDKQPAGIEQLRQALITIIGNDGKNQPPRITHSGEHPSGGPLRITITPRPGWAHWDTTTQAKLENAINATMGPAWEAVEWKPNGVNTWERLPALPTLVPYPGHDDQLAWNEVPVGVDGYGQPALLTLKGLYTHTLIAGSTGAGKTSILRPIAAHLLHHGVLVAALDINYAGLAFLEDRPGVATAMDGFDSISRAVRTLRDEVEDRLAELKRTRTYRRPLVIIIDEVEQLFDRARQVQKRPTGVKEPPLVSDVHEILRTGRKVKVHVILATQRPDAIAIPGALRDQAVGRIAVGPLGQKAAEMMLDQQAERAKNTPDVEGRAVLRARRWTGWVQTYWMADPDDTDHAAGDRAAAETMLPPRQAQNLPNGSAAVRQIVTGDESGLDAQTEQGDLFALALGRAPSLPAAVTSDAPVVTGETPEEYKRRRARERQASHRKRKRAQLDADLDDPRHGTLSARVLGCKCAKCEPARMGL